MKQKKHTGEPFMQLAIRLARRGLGDVEPNPAVGAVIVKNGKLIGAGWHKKFGGPHAEINALNDCRKHGESPKDAEMFVTLEPCCHYGKTGPCTKALIEAKIKKVFIAAIDPSKHARGKGIRRLRKAGIDIKTGLCEREAKILNAPFMKYASTNKPWVTLKWAQTIDGKLAWKKSAGKERWISCEQSRRDVHNLRRQAGAILVGINTVLKDDPLLTPRPVKGKRPIRIVLDNQLRIPVNCKLIKTIDDAPVLVVTGEQYLRTKKAKQLACKGVQLLGFPRVKSNLRFLLKHLSDVKIQHLIVEGGPKVLGAFIKENLADEIIIYISPVTAGRKGEADIDTAFEKGIRLYGARIYDSGVDQKLKGYTKNGLKALGIRQ